LFYKVEQWSRDGMRVERLLYAGNNLAKAQDIFARAIINIRDRVEPAATRGMSALAPFRR
jgi:hypothetical protein